MGRKKCWCLASLYHFSKKKNVFTTSLQNAFLLQSPQQNITALGYIGSVRTEIWISYCTINISYGIFHVSVRTDIPVAQESLLHILHCNFIAIFETKQCSCTRYRFLCTFACGPCQTENGFENRLPNRKFGTKIVTVRLFVNTLTLIIL